MHVRDETLADFDVQVVAASHRQPVVIDFWAQWCGPCKALWPILEKLANEYAGKFLLAKVNSDENQELAVRYGVRGIPSVKAMVNGKIVNEFTGAQPESVVRERGDMGAASKCSSGSNFVSVYNVTKIMTIRSKS